MTTEADVACLVVGSGPAGAAAALALNALAIPTRWVTRDEAIGGTLLRVGNRIRNFAGVPASDGPTLAARLAEHAHERGVTLETSTRLCTVKRDGDIWWIELVRGDQVEHVRARAVVLCTGTRARHLGLPRERELIGRGVEISVTRNVQRYRGAAVAVVGGGDAAMEGALLLADVCPRVTVVHRSARFRGQARFVERVLGHSRITCRMETTVTALDADASGLRALSLSDGTRLEVAALFVRIGVEPAVPDGVPGPRSPDGYLCCDEAGRLAPGLFTAGDVCSPHHQSAAWAIGSGTLVAESVQVELGLKR